MLSFEEIEDCFPDGSYGDDAICVSAQWLHDFAHAIAGKERERLLDGIDECPGLTMEQDRWLSDMVRSNFVL